MSAFCLINTQRDRDSDRQKERGVKVEREPCLGGCLLVFKWLLYFDTRVSVSFQCIQTHHLSLSMSAFPYDPPAPAQSFYASCSALPPVPTSGISVVTAEPPLPRCQCRQQTTLRFLLVPLTLDTGRKSSQQYFKYHVQRAHQKPKSQASHASICSSPVKFPQRSVKHSHPVIVQAETPGWSYWGLPFPHAHGQSISETSQGSTLLPCLPPSPAPLFQVARSQTGFSTPSFMPTQRSKVQSHFLDYNYKPPHSNHQQTFREHLSEILQPLTFASISASSILLFSALFQLIGSNPLYTSCCLLWLIVWSSVSHRSIMVTFLYSRYCSQ